MDVVLTSAERTVAEQALARLSDDLEQIVARLNQRVLYGSPIPGELADTGRRIKELLAHLVGLRQYPAVKEDLKVDDLRLLRAALAHARRFRASQVQERQQLVRSQQLAEELQKTLQPLDTMLNGEPFSSIEPERIPRLADYVSPHGRESIEGPRHLRDPERDPKHQALLSSSLLLPDLEVFRDECEDRRRPLAIVFADLDDFKVFNMTLGEVGVDRYVLPSILNAVEAAAYGHGRAYRHGGDEFVLLLPNADATIAMELVRQLKAQVESLAFEGMSLRPRISAGIWITVPQSHLTPAELVDNASRAKQRSKEAGKSRITLRIERGSAYEESSVE